MRHSYIYYLLNLVAPMPTPRPCVQAGLRSAHGSIPERDGFAADVRRRDHQTSLRIAERQRRGAGEIVPVAPRPHDMSARLKVFDHGGRNAIFDEEDARASIQIAAGARKVPAAEPWLVNG